MANASIFTPLLTSISIYRLFLHPLRDFPGPRIARVTTWWAILKIAAGINKYQLHYELHRQYGPIVRIAPNHLSINRLDVLAKAYGPGTNCNKSQSFYDLQYEKSLQTEMDLKKHAARRPPWDKALSFRRCALYYPQIQALVEILMQQILEDSKRNEKGVHINHWLTCYTFDVMGELAYQKSYQCVRTGVIHQGIIDMKTAIETASIISSVPWLVRVLSMLWGAPKHLQGFVGFAKNALEERKQALVTGTAKTQTDVLSFLLHGKRKLTSMESLEDTMLVHIAGSDTTNSTLTFCPYRISTSPQVQAALFQEIRDAASSSPTLDWNMIKDLPLLGAVIDETLRMHPPAPAGFPRRVPPDGIRLEDGVFIPPETTVSCPTWTIQHDPKNFSDPFTWNPYRWLNQPVIHNRHAFFPFSLGPFQCVGKYFAYMEMRAVIANLVYNFHMRLAPGEDGYHILYKSEDQIAMVCQPLWLDMKPIERP